MVVPTLLSNAKRRSATLVYILMVVLFCSASGMAQSKPGNDAGSAYLSTAPTKGHESVGNNDYTKKIKEYTTRAVLHDGVSGSSADVGQSSFAG